MTEDEIHKIAAVESSHWWYVGTREICFSMLEPCLSGREPRQILDVGCGTGGNLIALSRLGTARGVDVDPLCVDYCRRKGLDAALGSMTAPGAAPESLDLLTMFDVLNQAERREMPAILGGMAAALRPGGVIAFREPALGIAAGPHDRAVNIRHRFRAPEVAMLLRDAGFEPLRVTYLNTLLLPPIVLARRLRNALSPGLVESDVKRAGAPLNAALLGILRIEKRLLRAGNLPFGISVFAVGRKGPAR